MKFKAEGIIPAALMPWKPDLSMDLAGLRSHMRELARKDLDLSFRFDCVIRIRTNEQNPR